MMPPAHFPFLYTILGLNIYTNNTKKSLTRLFFIRDKQGRSEHQIVDLEQSMPALPVQPTWANNYFH